MNLAKNEDAFFKLMHNQRFWRFRAVECIEVSSELWASRVRTLHVQPLRELLREYISPNRTVVKASIILPVGSFLRKSPPVDLRIEVDDKVVSLFSRKEYGKRQAAY